MPEVLESAPAAESAPASTPSMESANSAAGDAGVSRNRATGRFQAAGQPRESVSKSKDADSIHARVRARLEKFNEAGSDIKPADEAPEESEQPAEQANEKTAKNGGVDPTETATDGGSPAADEPAPEAAAEVTPASTLPAAHVRSLKAYGLSDEEIKTTPAALAAKLHDRRNQEISRWAEAGRKTQATQQQTPAPPAPPAQPTAPAAPPQQPQPQAPKPVDIEALKATYGADEPLIQHFAAQQAALAAQERELAEFRTFRQSWLRQQEQERTGNLIRDVDSFFADKAMAPHHATYGTTTVSLTAEQDAKRTEVLKLADAIVGGARQQGVNLTVQEALQHAFDSVAAPDVKQAARQEIRAELQKRNSGISLRPGGKTAPKPVVPERQELLSKARANLRKVFAGT